MNGDDERRIHPDEEDVNKGVPDLGDFMKPEQKEPAEEETVDLQSLLQEIRRVPSQPQSQVRKPAAPANTPAPAAKPAAAPSSQATQASAPQVASAPAAQAPQAAPAPARQPDSASVKEAAPEFEEDEDENEEEYAPVPVKAPVRRLSPEERARRKAEIEKKRRRVIIMMIATGVLLVVAIGMGIFYVVNSLRSPKNENSETTTITATSSSDTALAEPESSTTEQTTTEETTPAPTPTPDVTPFPAGGPNLSGYCVVIDPGHQAIPNREQEEMSSSMGGSKDKSAKGFNGVVSGIDESEINLDTALLLKAYLESLGCEVYITRETNDVDISNKERAEFAVSYNPDVYIRLFCNCANDSKTSGINVIVPSSGQYAESVVGWGDRLGDLVCASCGANYNGCWASGNYTGLNWASSVPSFMVRMGYLSNSDEEAKLLSEEYQYQICEGIAQFVATMPQR